MPGLPASGESLAGSALFQGLDRHARRTILGRGSVRRVRRREAFVHQGDPSQCLYLCRTGRIKITQVSEEGAEIILRVITPGQIFGGFGVLIDTAYPATAEALEASSAVAWNRRELEELFDRFPRLTANLMKILARRLREVEARLRELATERVAQRVARTLLRLGRLSGRRVDDGVLLDLTLSREELSQLSGTTLFTVSRLISEWQHQGLLASRRGRLVIRDTHGLVALAEDLLRRD
jgi:CRP-like cAMP-binding protein